VRARGPLHRVLLLPLAPVRGTIWIAEQLAAQADQELDEQTVVRRLLLEAEAALERGELTEREFDQIEDELLDRLDRSEAVADEQ
jgi:hypothetical protein